VGWNERDGVGASIGCDGESLVGCDGVGPSRAETGREVLVSFRSAARCTRWADIRMAGLGYHITYPSLGGVWGT
jgi:hypothetical protein